MKEWKTWAIFTVLGMMAFSVPAKIAAIEWSRRSCADPDSWAQKSWGRALAECQAMGGDLYDRSSTRELICIVRKEIKP